MIRALLAILVALALALGWSLWRTSENGRRADAAIARADALETERDALRATLVRDAMADASTDAARSATADQLAIHHDRAATVEAIAHAPRPPVPDVCPLPDPDLVRELSEGRDRVRAAEDRLRGLRRPAG